MKRKLSLKDPHMPCVESNMGRGNVSLSVQVVVNHTQLTNAMCCIQSWLPQDGEPQIDLKGKEIEKEMIGEEEIKEAKQGAQREEGIGIVTREISRLDHLEKEFRRLTRKKGNLTLKTTLIKKEEI